MVTFIDRVVARPLAAFWLRIAPKSSHRVTIAGDSPQVHAPGLYPDRILIAGDGASTGRGVATHDLGLPGYLARATSVLTGRATDIDIVVAGDMTARKCVAAIADIELSRFDAVVLSVGAVEALDLTTRARWTRDLAALLDRMERDAPQTTSVLLLSIPNFSAYRRFPGMIARATDQRVGRLNEATRTVIRDRPRVRYVVVGATDAHESGGASTYERWATSIAPTLADALVRHDGPNLRAEERHESDRLRAHDALGMAGRASDPELLRLAARTRSMFGAGFATVTLVGDDRQFSAAASGLATDDVALQEALCDMTIQRAEHLAVDDTSTDDRWDRFASPGADHRLRFFAGYPLESTDGQRVGVLCVMDTEPRMFTTQDAALLRLLALEAQRRLWAISVPRTQQDENSSARG